MRKDRLVEGFADVELGLFTVVPLVDRSQVAHDSGVDFAFGSALWTGFVFSAYVSVGFADAEGWG